MWCSGVESGLLNLMSDSIAGTPSFPASEEEDSSLQASWMSSGVKTVSFNPEYVSLEEKKVCGSSVTISCAWSCYLQVLVGPVLVSGLFSGMSLSVFLSVYGSRHKEAVLCLTTELHL